MRVLFSLFFLMEGLNWTLIIIMTIASFALGAIWHGPIFGKIWMRIHHGNKGMSDAEMKNAMKGMWKLMLAEFVATLLMVIGLACVIRAIPSMPPLLVGFMVWLAFTMPANLSAILWGNDPKNIMCTKVAISSTCRLVSLLATSFVLSM